MMAARQAGQGGQAGAGGPGGQRPVQPTTGAGNGQPGAVGPGGGGFRGPRGGIDEMLERFPTITAADLKVGDMIAVSSTKSASPDRITAIKLLAGVEPFIRAAQATSGGQRGQITQSLSIPGLEGISFP